MLQKVSEWKLFELLKTFSLTIFVISFKIVDQFVVKKSLEKYYKLLLFLSCFVHIFLEKVRNWVILKIYFLPLNIWCYVVGTL